MKMSIPKITPRKANQRPLSNGDSDFLSFVTAATSAFTLFPTLESPIVISKSNLQSRAAARIESAFRTAKAELH